MKTFSVKEIADLLNVDPETVRRWIRDEKLPAIKQSKKLGNVVTEDMLGTFLSAYPKYAKAIPPTKYTAAALLGGVVASTGLVIAQQVIKNNEAGKAEVSTADLIAMLEGNIAEQEKELASKNEELSAMKKEIDEMEESIEETNKLIVQLRAAEALEEAEQRKDGGEDTE